MTSGDLTRISTRNLQATIGKASNRKERKECPQRSRRKAANTQARSSLTEIVTHDDVRLLRKLLFHKPHNFLLRLQTAIQLRVFDGAKNLVEQWPRRITGGY